MSVRFQDLAPGAELPTLSKLVTREDVRAYAEVSGDRNPLHQDDEVARAAGFPGVIAHGMFTMAHLASCIVRWTGDPGSLRRLRTPFRAPAYPGDTLVAGGSIRSLDPGARRVVLDVWVAIERDGTTEYPIRRGVAEVQLA